MKILLTNDDGIFAPGIAAMYTALKELGDVEVVAPSQSQSGASHSITYKDPIVCTKVEVGELFDGYSIEGSPADCVKIAVKNLFREPFDLIVSGMNNGANAGVNIYYSGTVAAAMEGVFLGIPSIATSYSVEEHMDFDKAARYCCEVIRPMLPIKHPGVTNINIPALAEGEPKGVRVVSASCTAFEEYYMETEDAHGRTTYLLSGGYHQGDSQITDVEAITRGYISVTMLISDMNDHARNKKLQKQSKKLWSDFNASKTSNGEKEQN